VGPLPLVNQILTRLGLPAILERHVPTPDRRVALPYAHGLGILLRSLVVEREPIDRQGETVRAFAAGLYGVAAEVALRVDDDQIGRALDRLFDADRTALLTDVVVAVGQRFGVDVTQLHNDSTTIRFCGQYRAAGPGRRLRGRRSPWITYGYSKDHRPDLTSPLARIDPGVLARSAPLTLGD
jgi:hypothetical protein